jgi:crotonobetainyl-CoA:carnitine CoA-transferase CaiB-like acyl-CoA transferase
MLSRYRVLDLTHEHGLLCGQILADLGADVLQIEPPEGSSARRVGPWAKDEPGVERSLFFWAYARNKRSVVLDLQTDEGREQLRRLVRGADFLIESETPGRMAELGLGYDDLTALQPRLVYVSISPFGQTGPKRGWAATDLIAMAAGGPAYLSGERDRPPVRIRVPQAHAHAGSDAAVAALLAQRTGRGQHVDISMQHSATLATMFRILDAPLEQVPARRVSGGIQLGPAFIQSLYRLRDGWVVLGPGILPSTGHFTRRLMNWAADEGVIDREYADRDWGSFAREMLAGNLPVDIYEPVQQALEQLFSSRTKLDLMDEAVQRKLLLAPILSLDELVESRQLAEREFVQEMVHPDGERVSYPGPFARLEDSPIRYRLPPPRVGQHTAEVLAEPARSPAPRAALQGRPLEGVKILDLFWVLAGPGGTRMLADYGATVVKVESMARLDTLRVIPPYQFSHVHPEGAGGFQCANANKLDLTLDLTCDEGREIALDLVRWADVVTESFAPGVVDGYGLGWDTLREIKPELIMISSCLLGQTGPWKDFTGFGNLAASVTGFQQLASWPGRPPSGPFGAYTDFIAVRYNALAILAALEHRDQTGRGQYIDQSQGEAALHFLAPAFLDYTVNGRVQGAAGNDDPELSPHGVYPALGDDRWVAIAVRDERDWRALCDVLGRDDLERGDTDAVDAALGEFTSTRGADEVAVALQARGVPAHAVLDTPELYSDPHLQERGHFQEVAHEIYGTSTVESSRLVMSDLSPRAPEAALSFGRDNRQVLEDLLGYSPEHIAALAERGVLS